MQIQYLLGGRAPSTLVLLRDNSYNLKNLSTPIGSKDTESNITKQLVARFRRSPRVANRYLFRINPKGLFKDAPKLQYLTIQRRRIDILVFDKKTKQVMAVEVKYTRRGTVQRFYQGIDQTLSLLLYGFNSVSLHHVYSSSLSTNVRKRGLLAWKTIRILHLPMNYTFVEFEEKNGRRAFYNMLALWENLELKRGKRVGSEKYEHRWKRAYKNPFLKQVYIERPHLEIKRDLLMLNKYLRKKARTIFH